MTRDGIAGYFQHPLDSPRCGRYGAHLACLQQTLTAHMPSKSIALARSSVVALSTVHVRKSPIHGNGAFAAVDLAESQVVGTYAGRRYSSRMGRPPLNGKLTYLFALSDGSTIDGSVRGNATRHINHSCAPNVMAVEVNGRRGQLVVEIIAKQAIKRGEELLLDYSLDLDGEHPSLYACYCGAECCRGSMAVSTS